MNCPFEIRLWKPGTLKVFVNVVETTQARHETADLGDFLTRTEGVEVLTRPLNGWAT